MLVINQLIKVNSICHNILSSKKYTGANMERFKILLFSLVMFSLPLYADNDNWDIRLNYIAFPLTVEAWATTQSAKVTVNVSATLSDKALDTIQQQVQQNLKKIVPNATWHITRFYRSQNSSGLEQIQVSAQARIPNSQLANLRSKAKAVSQPGQQYKIAGIDYSPSLAEVEKTKLQLRQQIYQQAKSEIAAINKLYDAKNYFLHQIIFQGANVTVMRPRTMMLAPEAVSKQSMAVSDKIVLRANVIVASLLPASGDAAQHGKTTSSS